MVFNFLCMFGLLLNDFFNTLFINIKCFSFFWAVVVILFVALLVSTGKNSIYSVFSLIVAFLVSSFVFIFIGLEFLGLILVIVYIGAVIVFFLFVVMMVNLNENYESGTSFFWVFFVAFFYFLFIYTFGYNFTNQKMVFIDFANNFLYVFNTTNFISLPNFFEIQFNNIEYLSLVLYSDYSIIFIYSGFILLVAIFGSVGLSVETKILNRFGQDSTDQLLKQDILNSKALQYWDKFNNNESKKG